MVLFGHSGSIWAKWVHLRKTGCSRAKLLYSVKVVVFWQSGCISAKAVVFGQSGSIWANVVVFRQSGCIWTKVVVFGQSGCI